MSVPLTPADYFKPVLASARLHNELKGDINAEELRQKVVENLRLNFLRLFHSDSSVELPEPTSLTPSNENLHVAHSIISRLHQRYDELINRPQIFNYYIEDEDLALADEFRTGVALEFLQETLAPYLADMADRGICSEKVLEEKYNEFLGMMPNHVNIAAEEFWDSPVVMMYSSHMSYKIAAEQLRQDDNSLPIGWNETEKLKQENQDNRSERPEEFTDLENHRARIIA